MPDLTNALLDGWAQIPTDAHQYLVERMWKIGGCYSHKMGANILIHIVQEWDDEQLNKV